MYKPLYRPLNVTDSLATSTCAGSTLNVPSRTPSWLTISGGLAKGTGGGGGAPPPPPPHAVRQSNANAATHFSDRHIVRPPRSAFECKIRSQTANQRGLLVITRAHWADGRDAIDEQGTTADAARISAHGRS